MAVKRQTFSTVNDTYEDAHGIVKGDPRVNGPYLDDIEQAHELEYRTSRVRSLNADAKKAKSSTRSSKKTTKSKEEKASEKEVRKLAETQAQSVPSPEDKKDHIVEGDVENKNFKPTENNDFVEPEETEEKKTATKKASEPKGDVSVTKQSKNTKVTES